MKAISLAVLLSAPLCAATLSHTYVSSGSGSDSNTCDRTHPCLTLAGALVNTSSGGEIDVLDTGDYGGLTIDRPLTIDGAGALATTGEISVNTTGVVILRNLSITAPTGVDAIGAAALRVEHVTITGTSGMIYGVICGAGSCSLKDVRIQNFQHSGQGAAVLVEGPAKVSVTDCTLTGNDIGIAAFAGGLAEADNNFIQYNTIGVSTNDNSTGAGGTIRLGDNTITDNTTGLQVAGTGASIISYGDNRIFGNVTNGNPTVVTTNR